MPATAWASPVANLNGSSYTVAAGTLGTGSPYDISPAQVIIPAMSLNLGTRVRLTAHGSYIGTGTTSTFTFGFYMTAAVAGGAAANNIVATSAVLGVGPAITCISATGVPWTMQYWGVIQKLSAPGSSLTNASIVGRGMFTYGSGGTPLVVISDAPIPQTLAACTVAETGTPGFGLQTSVQQLASVGVTVTTGTNFTSITTDEFTCELLG